VCSCRWRPNLLFFNGHGHAMRRVGIFLPFFILINSPADSAIRLTTRLSANLWLGNLRAL
jgi:hypothetical protein